MKGKITDWSKKELEEEILSRMNSLDISEEEYTDEELLKDFKQLIKKQK